MLEAHLARVSWTLSLQGGRVRRGDVQWARDMARYLLWHSSSSDMHIQRCLHIGFFSTMVHSEVMPPLAKSIKDMHTLFMQSYHIQEQSRVLGAVLVEHPLCI